MKDVAEVVNGGTPKTKVSKYWDGHHMWITPAEMGRLRSPYLKESKRRLTDSGLKNCSASLVPAQSVILSTRAPIGHLVINSVPMAFNQGCRGIVPGEKIHYKYLYYFLGFSVELLNDLGTGTTFKELAAGKLNGVEIPLPPLPEQKLIVATLDEAFAGIDTAIANTEKNLANAGELFESYLKSVFTEEYEKWGLRKLGDIAVVQSGGTPLRSKSEYWSGDISWYSSGELNGLVTDSPARCITESGLANSNAKKFAKGALLIGMYDTAALKMSILDREAAFNQAIAGVAPSERLDLRYVYFAINAFKPSLLLQRRGVRQKNLSLGKIKSIEIPVPDLDVQQDVSERLLSLESDINHIRGNGQIKLAALAELKQSLLEKAFSGELTADAADIGDVMEAALA